MFFGCSSLTELNISNLNTHNVTNMSFMFNGCENLKEINISNFNVNKECKIKSIFGGINKKNM